ncbi:AsnC family transcriptional regulator [Seohaeicola zhoushanensis]
MVGNIPKIDKFDIEILSILRTEVRTSVLEISERIGLSATPSRVGSGARKNRGSSRAMRL